MDIPQKIYSEKEQFLMRCGFDPIKNKENIKFDKDTGLITIKISDLNTHMFSLLAKNFLIKSGDIESVYEKIERIHNHCNSNVTV